MSRSGALEDSEIAEMIRDSFRGINDSYNPTKKEILAYRGTHDLNGDGILTLEDMENSVIRCFPNKDSLGGRVLESVFEESESLGDMTRVPSRFDFANVSTLLSEKEQLMNKLLQWLSRDQLNHEMRMFRDLF